MTDLEFQPLIPVGLRFDAKVFFLGLAFWFDLLEIQRSELHMTVGLHLEF